MLVFIAGWPVNMLSVFIAGWPLICCLSLFLDGREYAVCLYCWVAVNMVCLYCWMAVNMLSAACLYCWMAVNGWLNEYCWVGVNMLPVFIAGWPEYAVCLYCWVTVLPVFIAGLCCLSLLLDGREYAVCLYDWMAVNMLSVFIAGWP